MDDILDKIELLKDTLLDYAGDRYDINQWPDELQYDLDDIETIEIGITEYNIPAVLAIYACLFIYCFIHAFINLFIIYFIYLFIYTHIYI